MQASLFLSTPSARRATGRFAPNVVIVVISIHALREEGDVCQLCIDADLMQFLSTPSARRATHLPHYPLFSDG